MKHDIRTDSWFLFPLSLPPMQRYLLLIGLAAIAVSFWWCWIYNPLRRHRAGLSYQLQSIKHDAVIKEKLIALSQSLTKLSCKELSSIASISRVTFDEIRFQSDDKAHISFYGSYDSLIRCLNELYERCPKLHITKLYLVASDQSTRHISLDVTHLATGEL